MLKKFSSASSARRFLAATPNLKILALLPVMQRYSGSWPRPDQRPPSKIPVSKLVPPFMRGMYIRNLYYPEAKLRTEEPATEEIFGATIQFILYHLCYGIPMIIVYFLYIRRVPKTIKVGLAVKPRCRTDWCRTRTTDLSGWRSSTTGYLGRHAARTTSVAVSYLFVSKA